MKKSLIIFALMLVAMTSAFAQNIKMQGNVISKTDGEPIIGASVYVTDNQTIGTMTDFDGNFSLEVPASSTVTISYIGFTSQVVKAQAQVNIILEEDSQMLEEMVVVGYTVQRKADLTGAVAVMDMKKPTSEGNPSMIASMQGRLAGVQITTDATPGSGGSTIRVRGMSSINGSDPLYIIDGVPTTENLSSLNPADIESIQVLKDAASASIYGSRAANGVIIITTKRGKGDRLSVNVGYSASFQKIAQKYDLLNANEWGKVYMQAMANDGATPSYNIYNENGSLKATTADGYTLADNDWQDAIYQSAWTHNLSANVSNSSEKGTMMLSLNYINQGGIQKESFYERFSARVNTTYNISEHLSVGENLMVAKWISNASGNGGDRGMASLAMLQHPGIPTYQPDGKYSNPLQIVGSDYANPVHALYNNRDNQSENWRIFGNAYAEWKPVKGLTLKTNIGIEHSQYNSDALGRKLNDSDDLTVSRGFGQGDTWTWTNTATYVGNWGKHSLVGLLGTEAIGYKFDGFSAFRRGYAFDDKNYMVIGAGDGTQTNGGGKNAWGLFSYFAKADYNYADRYLASFTIRRDATSRLGKTDNSGIFPAFTLAWRPSREDFWKENDILTDLKVRAAWGQNGNAAVVSEYASYSTLGYDKGNGAYDLNGTNTNTVAGIKVLASGNPDLKWETTTQTNIGLDLQFLKGAVNFSADWYIKKTTDMLTVPPTLSVAGENAACWRNTGDMKNTGIEFTLDYRSPEYGDFSWSASANLSKYKNEVVKLNDAITSQGSDIRLMAGQPMGIYYGWIADGLFQTQEEVDNYAIQQGKGLGRIKYRDIDGNGVIDEKDQCIIGDPNPDWSAGLNLDFNYKGFTLSMFFTGEFGFDIYNANKRQLDFMSSGNTYTNRGKDILKAWTKENTGAKIPAVSYSDNNNEKRMSTYFVEDGSYLKMKYIKLGYNAPEKWCKALKASNINLYGQLENIFTLTGYSGLDPELNLGGYGARVEEGAYPRSRTFTLGINVSF